MSSKLICLLKCVKYFSVLGILTQVNLLQKVLSFSKLAVFGPKKPQYQDRPPKICRSRSLELSIFLTTFACRKASHCCSQVGSTFQMISNFESVEFCGI